MNQTQSDQGVIERARYTALKAAEDRRLSDAEMIDVAVGVVLGHVQSALIDNPYGRTEAYEDAAEKVAQMLAEIGVAR